MGKNGNKGLKRKKIGTSYLVVSTSSVYFLVLVYVGCRELEQLECKILLVPSGHRSTYLMFS